MTTTKEDQMRAKFRAWYKQALWASDYFETLYFTAWKACAESYEKKLAEKDAEIAKLKTVPMRYRRMEFNAQLQKQLSEANVELEGIAADTQSLANDLHRTEVKLSETNARNAMLVEALEPFAENIPEDYDASCHSGITTARKCGRCGRGYKAYQAITANSDSVAAWEAEKLEPLRREVAMLHATLLYKHPVIIPESAAQLHIKELRAAGIAALQDWELLTTETTRGAIKLEQALAKQPDTRALDKALLEARIDQTKQVLATMNASADWELYIPVIARDLNELRAKLAELNKENPA